MPFKRVGDSSASIDGSQDARWSFYRAMQYPRGIVTLVTSSLTIFMLTRTYESLTKTSANIAPESVGSHSAKGNAILGLFLHAVLVAVHAILVAVFCLHLEHNVSVDAGRTTTVASQTITAIFQLFGTVPYAYTGAPVPLKVLACQLFILSGTVNMSYPLGEIVGADKLFAAKGVPEDRFGRTLRNWTYVQQEGWASSLATWLSMSASSSTSVRQDSLLRGDLCRRTGGDLRMCERPVMDTFDDHVADCLSSTTANTTSILQNATISALGDCLSRTAAVLVWQGRNTMGNTSPRLDTTIITQELVHRSRLNLNPIPLFIGLGASVALLVLAYLLTWPHGSPTVLHKDLTNPGIL